MVPSVASTAKATVGAFTVTVLVERSNLVLALATSAPPVVDSADVIADIFAKIIDGTTDALTVFKRMNAMARGKHTRTDIDASTVETAGFAENDTTELYKHRTTDDDRLPQ